MKKVLVVEDDNALLNVLHDKLIAGGLTVLLARDGAEGLKTALRERPDVILLDLRMPKMDGMTMMHKLREDEWGNKASIIILTNLYANDERLTGVVANQPSYYLIKADTSLEKVLEKVRSVLESKKEASN